METSKSTDSELLMVVPCCSTCGGPAAVPIRVIILIYWDGHCYRHPVNERTVQQFMKQVALFGATVWTEGQECWAFNREAMAPGIRRDVFSISYRGEVIYRQS